MPSSHQKRNLYWIFIQKLVCKEGERGRKWDQRSQQGMAFRDLWAAWVEYDGGGEVGGGGESGAVRFFI